MQQHSAEGFSAKSAELTQFIENRLYHLGYSFSDFPRILKRLGISPDGKAYKLHRNDSSFLYTTSDRKETVKIFLPEGSIGILRNGDLAPTYCPVALLLQES